MRRTPFTAALLMAAMLIHANALADGGFFIRRTVRSKLVTQPRQEAVIVRDGAEVTVIIRSVVSGDVDELAWVYPVPAVVTDVREAKHETFEQLDELTAPEFIVSTGGDGGLIPCFGCGVHRARLENETAGRPMVRVEAEGTAGMYDWKCLSSEGADALLTWLKDNQFAVPKKSREALDHYIRRKMFFLAFRVRIDRKAEGAAMIHPVAFSYKSASLVYPMVISRPTAAAKTEVLLYVIGRETFEVDGFTQFTIGENEISRDDNSPSGTTYEAVFRRHVRDAGGRAICREATVAAESPVTRILARGEKLWVTRLRTILSPEKMDRDFVLKASGEEPEHRTSRYHLSDARGSSPGQVAATGVHFVAVAACSTVALHLGVHRRKRRWRRWAGLGVGLVAILLFAVL